MRTCLNQQNSRYLSLASLGCVGWLLYALSLTAAHAQSAVPTDDEAEAKNNESRYHLVEEFTAHTLAPGEFKLGNDADYGISSKLMLGTDVVALAMGASSLQAKYLLWENKEHKVALGLRVAYLSRQTLLWGSLREHFTTLDARLVRPGISWTNDVSPRLRLHTFWAKGFGRIDANLSEKGKRKLWEAKHPGADYDSRDNDTQSPTAPGQGANPSENQEETSDETSSLTQRSIQVQSITGLAQERFQLTGEFIRANGNKILLTTRAEQTKFEDLRANFLRFTAAHQWIWTNFQMRLGMGVQYFVLSGRDLDGEKIDDAGVQPAPDLTFYWRF